MKTKLNQKQLKRCHFQEKRNEKKNKAKTSSFSFLTKENQNIDLNKRNEDEQGRAVEGDDDGKLGTSSTRPNARDVAFPLYNKTFGPQNPKWR